MILTLVFAFTALVCAFAAAQLLDLKQRSSVAGIALGLFLGPLGLMLAVLIPPPRTL